jgi:SPP1 family predicted phage head-tail adaptor
MKKRRLFDIGRMRHRVSVFHVNREDDGSGGFDRKDPVDNEVGPLVLWAHIQPVTGRELQWGEQFTEVTTHACWLRYNVLVQPGMILRFRNVNYYIEQAYDPDNLQEFLLLTLREGGPA